MENKIILPVKYANDNIDIAIDSIRNMGYAVKRINRGFNGTYISCYKDDKYLFVYFTRKGKLNVCFINGFDDNESTLDISKCIMDCKFTGNTKKSDLDKYEKVLNKKIKFYAKELFNENWTGTSNINTRFKSTMGKCYPETRLIQISDKLFRNDMFLDMIIIHELCHWYCYIKGMKWKDGSNDFENTILKTKCSCSTKTMSMDAIGNISHKNDKNFDFSEELKKLNKKFNSKYNFI